MTGSLLQLLSLPTPFPMPPPPPTHTHTLPATAACAVLSDHPGHTVPYSHSHLPTSPYRTPGIRLSTASLSSCLSPTDRFTVCSCSALLAVTVSVSR